MPRGPQGGFGEGVLGVGGDLQGQGSGVGTGWRGKGMGTRPAAPWRWQQRPQSLSPACPLPPPRAVTPPRTRRGGRLGAWRRVTSLGHQTPNGDPQSQLQGVGDGAPHSRLGAGFPVRVPTLQPEMVPVPGGGTQRGDGEAISTTLWGQNRSDATCMGVGWRGMAPPQPKYPAMGLQPQKIPEPGPIPGGRGAGGTLARGDCPSPKVWGPVGMPYRKGESPQPPRRSWVPPKTPTEVTETSGCPGTGVSLATLPLLPVPPLQSPRPSRTQLQPLPQEFADGLVPGRNLLRRSPGKPEPG